MSLKLVFASQRFTDYTLPILKESLKKNSWSAATVSATIELTCDFHILRRYSGFLMVLEAAQATQSSRADKFKYLFYSINTVDVRNPAPPGMYKTL